MRTSVTRRIAFTLIELLVVIAIIGILMGLMTVAVMKILVKGPEMQTANEVTQLANEMQNFKARFNCYPPSRMQLSNDPTKMDPVTLSYIQKIWPRIEFGNVASPIDWTGGTNKAALDAGSVVLEGDQCLVFFLGGMPAPGPALQGFSKNPKNPTEPLGPTNISADRDSFYEFNTGRLYFRSGTAFYSYSDFYHPFDSNLVRPYIYYSSYNRKDSYRDTDAANITYPMGTLVISTSPSVVYNPVPVTIAVSPYYSSIINGNKLYLNSSSFQIISAGTDAMFGTGGIYDSRNPPPAGTPDFDNQTNFAGKLGTGR